MASVGPGSLNLLRQDLSQLRSNYPRFLDHSPLSKSSGLLRSFSTTSYYKHPSEATTAKLSFLLNLFPKGSLFKCQRILCFYLQRH